ncbi:MAG: acyl-CoA desaturase [Flavobacteriales bacterium]|nr:acyl-CoA desaturase [Flavobacteriales bacterium]
MNVPKYISSGPGRQFGAAVRQRVTAHFKETGISQKSDHRLWPKVATMLALFLVPSVLVLTVAMPWWVLFPLAVLTGVGMAGVGMGVMHDALHGATSRRTWVNELLGSSMYLLGSDVFVWRFLHNEKHHTHTNVAPHDEDIDPPALLRFSEHAPLKRAHRWQYLHAFFFYGLLTLVKLGNDFFTLHKASRQPRHQDRNYTGAYLGMVGVKLAHLFVFIGLPLLLTSFTWWQVLLGFVLMHFTASVIMGVVFQLAHVVEGAEQPAPDEHGIIATDWTEHELRTTADFAPGNRLVTWYTGGLNYQIEHHLFPYISHLHYPAIAPIVQRTAEEFGLPYNVKPTTRKAIRSHVRRLHELGHRP